MDVSSLNLPFSRNPRHGCGGGRAPPRDGQCSLSTTARCAASGRTISGQAHHHPLFNHFTTVGCEAKEEEFYKAWALGLLGPMSTLTAQGQKIVVDCKHSTLVGGEASEQEREKERSTEKDFPNWFGVTDIRTINGESGISSVDVSDKRKTYWYSYSNTCLLKKLFKKVPSCETLNPEQYRIVLPKTSKISSTQAWRVIDYWIFAIAFIGI